jgi:hypothetical protein
MPNWDQDFDHLIFVCSGDEESASLRIHYFNLWRALSRRIGAKLARITPGKVAGALPPRSCILFHYDDAPAIAALRRAGWAGQSALSVCFGSDIRAFRLYNGLRDCVDCFAMPSAHHVATLGLGCVVPARLLREGVDPVVMQAAPVEKPAPSRNLVWFGYPESYYLSMRPYAPVLARSAAVERFALITNARLLDPRAAGPQVIPYSTARFAQDLAPFTYAMLSHTPADLQVNTMIKSPNKVITAIWAGLVPLASATPNYAAVMEDLGLQRFLFTGPLDLAQKLDRLSPQADVAGVDWAGLRARLAQSLGDEAVLGDFATLVGDILPQVPSIRRFVATLPAPSGEEDHFLNLGPALREIVPGAKRALRRRWNLLRGA